MTVVVVDSSVLAPALADDGASGSVARERLRSEQLTAPELIDLEVASVLRGLVMGRELDADRAAAALDDLALLPIRRVSHHLLVARCWQLRHNLTCYDAAYVTVAELLDVRLVTADGNVGKAAGVRCAIEVLSVGQ